MEAVTTFVAAWRDATIPAISSMYFMIEPPKTFPAMLASVGIMRRYVIIADSETLLAAGRPFRIRRVNDGETFINVISLGRTGGVHNAGGDDEGGGTRREPRDRRREVDGERRGGGSAGGGEKVWSTLRKASSRSRGKRQQRRRRLRRGQIPRGERVEGEGPPPFKPRGHKDDRGPGQLEETRRDRGRGGGGPGRERGHEAGERVRAGRDRHRRDLRNGNQGRREGTPFDHD